MHIPRYRFAARWYDELSLEAVLYRGGRTAAIDLARIGRGDRVLDAGCGTGLSFPALVAAVGPGGCVVGVDASAAMLAGARRRVQQHGWRQVELIEADARAIGHRVRGPFDVVLFAYSLSIVADWPVVWRSALDSLAPGGRVAVVDSDYLTGWRRVANPFLSIMLKAGGVHPERRVWDAVARDTTVTARRDLRGGHVHVAVGER